VSLKKKRGGGGKDEVVKSIQVIQMEGGVSEKNSVKEFRCTDAYGERSNSSQKE